MCLGQISQGQRGKLLNYILIDSHNSQCEALGRVHKDNKGSGSRCNMHTGICWSGTEIGRV